MNIFVLDLDPHKAAIYHVDKHIIKMPLETAQMLCSVLNKFGYKTPYKSSHVNHPCTLWAAKSKENFMWLRLLGLELGQEYQHRYGKIHKCYDVIKSLEIPKVSDFKTNEMTPFAQAMPDIYRDKDVVLAYRKYYIGAKKHLIKYTNRDMPYWIRENICLTPKE